MKQLTTLILLGLLAVSAFSMDPEKRKINGYSVAEIVAGDFGWQRVAPGIFEKQGKEGSILRYATGPEGRQYAVDQLSELLAELEDQFESNPSDELEARINRINDDIHSALTFTQQKVDDCEYMDTQVSVFTRADDLILFARATGERDMPSDCQAYGCIYLQARAFSETNPSENVIYDVCTTGPDYGEVFDWTTAAEDDRCIAYARAIAYNNGVGDYVELVESTPECGIPEDLTVQISSNIEYTSPKGTRYTLTAHTEGGTSFKSYSWDKGNQDPDHPEVVTIWVPSWKTDVVTVTVTTTGPNGYVDTATDDVTLDGRGIFKNQ